MLKYICPRKGFSTFSKEMKLEFEKDGEKLPVQLWSDDMTWEVNDASFMRFERYFASKLMILLTRKNPRIRQSLS